MQMLRSFVYVLYIYAAMPVMAIYYTPLTLLNKRNATRAVKAWCCHALWAAKYIVGLHVEVKGEIPTGDVVIASKHQSFLDVIILVAHLPQPRFVMKKSLLYAPVLGWYARAIGCIPVERGKGSDAIRQMLSGINNAHGGQLIIYPQGTRVPPGEKRPYKIGAAVLYEAMGQSCVPVAVNVGLFWPRKGIYRKAGTATLSFLPEIEAGQSQEVFLKQIEASIEAASVELIELAER